MTTRHVVNDIVMKFSSDGKPLIPEVIEDWLIFAVMQLKDLNSEDVDIKKPFTGHGLDLEDLSRMHKDLETWVGERLPPSLLFDHCTIQVLIPNLAKQLASSQP